MKAKVVSALGLSTGVATVTSVGASIAAARGVALPAAEQRSLDRSRNGAKVTNRHASASAQARWEPWLTEFRKLRDEGMSVLKARNVIAKRIKQREKVWAPADRTLREWLRD